MLYTFLAFQRKKMISKQHEAKYLNVKLLHYPVIALLSGHHVH